MGKVARATQSTLESGPMHFQKPIATGGRKELRWGWRVVRNSGAVMMVIIIIASVTLLLLQVSLVSL